MKERETSNLRKGLAYLGTVASATPFIGLLGTVIGILGTFQLLRGGQVDITSGKFVFSASEAFWVEGGKIQYPVKGATIIGNGPDALTRVSMIGNDMKLDTGVGVCGKDGQSVPVGVGQPTLRIDRLTVGGTA